MTAHSQRGVALLTILLLVVSITVVAGAMLASQKIAIRQIRTQAVSFGGVATIDWGECGK